jgi:hypothetical protein
LYHDIFFAEEFMMDLGKNELQDLLKEGAAALIEMRKGIENACAELRTIYRKTLPRSSLIPKVTNGGNVTDIKINR